MTKWQFYNSKQGSVEIQSSFDWDAPSEQQKQPKAMSEFKEQVIESVDAHSTITEKTEEDQTSAWDSEDPSEIESIGQGVKAKAGMFVNFTHESE